MVHLLANYVGDYLHTSVLYVSGSNTASGTIILSYGHSADNNQIFYLVDYN